MTKVLQQTEKRTPATCLRTIAPLSTLQMFLTEEVAQHRPFPQLDTAVPTPVAIQTYHPLVHAITVPPLPLLMHGSQLVTLLWLRLQVDLI